MVWIIWTVNTPLIFGPLILIIFHFFRVWYLKISTPVRESNDVDHLDRQYPLFGSPDFDFFLLQASFSFQYECFK